MDANAVSGRLSVVLCGKDAIQILPMQYHYDPQSSGVFA
jgi:hypothetical protein